MLEPISGSSKKLKYYTLLEKGIGIQLALNRNMLRFEKIAEFIGKRDNYLHHGRNYFSTGPYEDRKDKTLIDVGCGTGISAYLLSWHYKTILGIDISPDVVEIARETTKERENVQIVQADLFEFRIKYMFDHAILVGCTLGNFENEDEVLTKIKSFVKPGGRIIFDLYGEESVGSRLKLYKEAGFENVRIDGNSGIIRAEPNLISKTYTFEQVNQILRVSGMAGLVHVCDIGYVIDADV
jgi:ubiquinone/menaquinone biosynthesis C-methylase UbiE